MAPVEEAAVESGHRISMVHAMTHSSFPLVDELIIWGGLLTVVVCLLALADLVLRGRFRATSLSLTRMQSRFVPLLGLFGAAWGIADIMIKMTERNLTSPEIWLPSVAIAALLVALGAAGGGIGVILTAILRIDSARHAVKLGD